MRIKTSKTLFFLNMTELMKGLMISRGLVEQNLLECRTLAIQDWKKEIPT